MKVYAIVRPDGSIKRSKRSHHLQIYVAAGTAQRAALSDGDAVVEVDIDLTREPLFIRRRAGG
jgi:hypothetical protein